MLYTPGHSGVETRFDLIKSLPNKMLFLVYSLGYYKWAKLNMETKTDKIYNPVEATQI